MRKCNSCGSEFGDEQKFCSNCGAVMPEPVPAAPVQPQPQPQAGPQPVQPVYSYQEPPRAQSQAQPVQYGAEPTTVQPTSYDPAKFHDESNKTNGLCIAGFILSIVSVFLAGLTSFISLILSICGLAVAGKKKNKGKGLAIAGIILSAIMIVFWIAAIIYAVNDYIPSVKNRVDVPSTTTKSIDINLDDIFPTTESNNGEPKITISGEGINTGYQSPAEIKSIITGNKWIASGDNSYLVFESGNKFKYYQSASDTSDNYYSGTYHIYVGSEALNYVVKDLEKYSVTEDELLEIFERNDKYDLTNFIVIALDNDECIVGGQNTLESPVFSPYYGAIVPYDDGSALDIVNMNKGTKFFFTPEK